MIHHDITARGAGFVRAWVFMLWAFYLVNNNSHEFVKVPDVELDPPGILKLLPDGFYEALMTTAGLTTLNWVLLAGVIACAFGVRPWRLIAIPTVLLLTLHQGIPRGLFDYVNHKELGALYATYILAVFPPTGFSPFAPKEPKPRTDEQVASTRMMMLLLMAVLLIPYTFVGLYRLAHNDMSVWTSDTFAHFIARTSYGTNWFENTAISEALLTRRWILQALAISFPLGTIVEVLAPLCIVHKRFRRFWVLSMAGLHVLTWLAMDILFWENLALYPVLLADGDYLLNKFDQLRARLRGSADPDPVDPDPVEPAGDVDLPEAIAVVAG